jgi:hypothetical protein
MFDIKLFKNSNFNIFFFFKIYSNATDENMILKLIRESIHENNYNL